MTRPEKENEKPTGQKHDEPKVGGHDLVQVLGFELGVRVRNLASRRHQNTMAEHVPTPPARAQAVNMFCVLPVPLSEPTRR